MVQDVNDYFKSRIGELKELAKRGDVWIFLCNASMVEYLAKLVYNKETTTGSDYKRFVKRYLSQVNLKYKDFQYKSGKKDLPEQMYHVLRCGVIHAFSTLSTRAPGRDRSIVLAHKKSGHSHLANVTENGLDAASFLAEEFTNDLDKLVDYIFAEAKKDLQLRMNIRTYFDKYPPIDAILRKGIDTTDTGFSGSTDIITP